MRSDAHEVRDLRAIWIALGVVLLAAAVGVGVVGVLAFGRVPDAPPGETRDLALGLMCALLALVCAVMAWACIATGRRATVADDVGAELDDDELA